MPSLTIGHFPYQPGHNPYQRLFADALESAGLNVLRIPPRKAWPIHFALSHPADLIHMDWPHDFYRGRTPLRQLVKRIMYRTGLRKLKGRPLVWTAHNLVCHDATQAQRRYEQSMIQALVDCCDGVMVLSEAAGQLLRATYRLPASARVAVVPHGHYIDVYPNEIAPEAARRQLGIAPAARVVLSLGRMRRYKGLVHLVEAFAAAAGGADVLVLAGAAPDAGLVADLRDAARRTGLGDRVRIHPELVKDELLQVYFNAADVVALPFREILNSGTALLAMGFGRCLVAPEMGSIPEVACPTAYFGYSPDDPDGLAAALAGALSLPDLHRRGLAAREFVRSRYGWDEIGRKARALYEEIVGRS